jgi:Protein of unknown function (DUF2786)
MTTEREGLLDKVRGLLSKTVTNGCTEAEALTALSKARAMMDAYCVTEGELNLTKDEKAILRREPPGSKDPHRIIVFRRTILRLPRVAHNSRADSNVLWPAVRRTVCNMVAQCADRVRAGRANQLSDGRRPEQAGPPGGNQKLRRGVHGTDQPAA